MWTREKYVIPQLRYFYTPANRYSEYRDYPRNEFGLTRWEEVEIPTSDGLTLNGWLVHPDGASKGTVLALHGSEADMRSSLKATRFLIDQGYRLFVFNARDNLLNTERTFLREDFEDIGLAIAWVKDRYKGNSHGMAIMGFSYGGMKAVMAGARFSDLNAVIDDGGPTSHWDHMKYCTMIRDREKDIEQLKRTDPNLLDAYIDFVSSTSWVDYAVDRYIECTEEVVGYPVREFDAELDAPRISPRPLLVIHGELDRQVDMACSRKIYKAAREPKELFVPAKTEHIMGMFQAKKTYIPKVVGFLDAYLLRE